MLFSAYFRKVVIYMSAIAGGFEPMRSSLELWNKVVSLKITEASLSAFDVNDSNIEAVWTSATGATPVEDFKVWK